MDSPAAITNLAAGPYLPRSAGWISRDRRGLTAGQTDAPGAFITSPGLLPAGVTVVGTTAARRWWDQQIVHRCPRAIDLTATTRNLRAGIESRTDGS